MRKFAVFCPFMILLINSCSPGDLGGDGEQSPFAGASPKTIAIKAVNGKYLSVAPGPVGKLSASANAIGQTEKFELVSLPSGKKALKSKANNKYVVAEKNGLEPLAANRDLALEWESFQLVDKGNKKFGLIAVNNRYVCAEQGGKGPIIANRQKMLEWETFEMEDPNQTPPPPPPPPPGGFGELNSIERGAMNDAEIMMIQSLQGILTQKEPQKWIWVRHHGTSDRFFQNLLNDYGATVKHYANPWDIVTKFKGRVSQYVLYDLHQDSENVASSLAGILGVLPITPSIENKAKAAGLTLKMDVRGKDEAWALQSYKNMFNKEIIVEQRESEQNGLTTHSHLRDFAASRKAFVYHNRSNPGWRRTVAQTLGPNALVFGWGEDEYQWVKGISEGAAAGIAADYASNLSVLQNVDEKNLKQKTATDPSIQDNVHYVAFIMSDGDNIQWLLNTFESIPDHWSSPHRGNFNVTWEMAPILADVAPSILHYYQKTATNTATARDFFVMGPSGHGYMFPSRYPSGMLPSFTAKLDEYAVKSDLHIASMLDDGNMDGDRKKACNAFLDRTHIDGVIYKPYHNYAGANGAIHWNKGKPCIAYRYVLGENMGGQNYTPHAIANALTNLPRKPLSDQKSYSLISIHAWSKWNGIGPMGAVSQTISLLPAHVKVINVDTMVKYLRGQFGSPSGPPPSKKTFEAEGEQMRHIIGRRDGDGWSAATALDQTGHMLYGPYTKDITPAGNHTATFTMMVDNNTANDHEVITVDVYDATAGTVLSKKTVRRKSFYKPFVYQDVGLNFNLSASSLGHELEFRAFWLDTSYVKIDKVVVE